MKRQQGSNIDGGQTSRITKLPRPGDAKVHECARAVRRLERDHDVIFLERPFFTSRKIEKKGEVPRVWL